MSDSHDQGAATDPGPAVLSLNYHEVTADPRVLKQARALAGAGYRVTVLCDVGDGLPTTDRVDGVSIRRFEVYARRDLDPGIAESMPFLNASREEALARYVPLAEAVSSYRALESRWSYSEDDASKLASPTSYKSKKGIARISAKLRRKLFLRRLRQLERSGAIRTGALIGTTEQRALFRGLLTARALVYASNALKVDLGFVPDVVHAHDIYTLPAGIVLASRFGARLVYDAHEYEAERASIPMSERGFAEAFEDDCLTKVDAMVTVSEEFARLYGRRFARRPPVVVMNTPEIAAVEPDPDGRLDVRRRCGLSRDVPLVSYTGGIQREHRGLDRVTEALARLPGYHLSIMGLRHKENDAWFMEAARNAGVEDRVHLLEPVDAREVPTAIAGADVSIIPFQGGAINHQFAMPNKLFEAAFAEVPICVSDLPEMRAFVERLGIGRAMDQEDSASIADAIRDIVENRERYRTTETARRVLFERYSWAAQRQKLLDLYTDLLGRSDAPRPGPGEGGTA